MKEILKTNHYKVMELMYNNTILIDGKKYCPLNQEEIANQLGLSRVAINKVFKELKENKYISMITRGKWALTRNGILVIEATIYLN